MRAWADYHYQHQEHHHQQRYEQKKRVWDQRGEETRSISQSGSTRSREIARATLPNHLLPSLLSRKLSRISSWVCRYYDEDDPHHNHHWSDDRSEVGFPLPLIEPVIVLSDHNTAHPPILPKTLLWSMSAPSHLLIQPSFVGMTTNLVRLVCINQLCVNNILSRRYTV